VSLLLGSLITDTGGTDHTLFHAPVVRVSLAQEGVQMVSDFFLRRYCPIASRVP